MYVMGTGWNQAGDWPQHLGPARNGSTPEAVALEWPNQGPRKLWKKDLGSGWASPIAIGAVCYIHHRTGDQEIIEALHTSDGSPIWKYTYPTEYRDSFGFDDGPRATPLYHRGKLFTLSPTGIIHALSADSGKPVWSVNAGKKYTANPGFFGLSSSPAAYGDHVIFVIGGTSNAGVIALAEADGKEMWRATEDEAGYASPMIADLDGSPVAVIFNRFGLNGLNPSDGQSLFRRKWRSSQGASVNAASPITSGNQIVVSSSYDTGTLVVKWENHELKEIWSNTSSLSAHYTTPLIQNGFLYGVDGRVDFPGDLTLKCLSLADGRVQWQRRLRTGASLIHTANAALIQLDDGELWLVELNPTEFTIRRRAQVQSGLVRALPALADGIYYVRSQDSLIAVDLRPIVAN